MVLDVLFLCCFNELLVALVLVDVLLRGLILDLVLVVLDVLFLCCFNELLVVLVLLAILRGRCLEELRARLVLDDVRIDRLFAEILVLRVRFHVQLRGSRFDGALFFLDVSGLGFFHEVRVVLVGFHVLLDRGRPDGFLVPLRVLRSG